MYVTQILESLLFSVEGFDIGFAFLELDDFSISGRETKSRGRGEMISLCYSPGGGSSSHNPPNQVSAHLTLWKIRSCTYLLLKQSLSKSGIPSLAETAEWFMKDTGSHLASPTAILLVSGRTRT